MRTSKPPPRIHIKEKRGSNLVLANGALRHGGYPLSPLLCRGSSTASMELKAYRPEMRGRDSRAAHLLLRVGSLKFPAFGLKRVLCAPDGFAEAAVFGFPPALPVLAAPV